MSDKKKVNRTIVSKLRKMNGKVELTFKQKTQEPVQVSPTEAEKWKEGDNYEPTTTKEEETEENNEE